MKMLTKAQIDRFIQVRNSSPFDSNLQFISDAQGCGFKIEQLGDCLKWDGCWTWSIHVKELGWVKLVEEAGLLRLEY